MKIRRIVSLIALLSFCVMAGTGVVMFLAPQSRVAYWNGWELFGLSKRDYDAIHSTFMLLFLTSIVWHTVLNWKFLVDYLKTSTRKLVVITPEFLLAMAICALFLVGTVWRSIPFDQYLGIAGVAKTYWRETLGSPPLAPADATPLGQFCHGMADVDRYASDRLVAIDCDQALSVLRQAGIHVDDLSQPMDDLAAANGTTPRAVSEIVMSVARPVSDDNAEALPD
jgi:hypothetical protein